MKKTIILSLTAILFIAFVSCNETKKEETTDKNMEKEKAFETSVQQMGDLVCEKAGLEAAMKELQVKYDSSATKLMEIELAADFMETCEFIDGEEIENFKKHLIADYLATKGENLIVEKTMNDDGTIESFIIKDQNGKAVETIAAIELSDEIQIDANDYVNNWCRINEIKQILDKTYTEFKEANKDDEKFVEKMKSSSKAILEKCEFLTPEKVEEIISTIE